MIRFHTRSGAEYLLDQTNKLVQRINSEDIEINEPTHDDGSWHTYEEIFLVEGKSAIIVWAGTQGRVTTPVVKVEEVHGRSV